MNSLDRTKFMQKTVVVWLGAMICFALWGSAYPCIKIGYRMFAIPDMDVFSQILFAGMILINLNGSELDLHMTFLGEGFIIISAIIYAFSSVMVKEFSKTENPVMLSGYQFVLGGVILVIIGLLFGGRLTGVSGEGVALFVYMAFISAVAYSLWGTLLKYNPVSRVAVFGFMNPVFGAVLSAVILKEGETAGVLTVLSLVLVCIGIYTVNHEKEAAK